LAVKALIAGRGIGRHYAIANIEVRDVSPHFGNDACHFVTKWGRGTRQKYGMTLPVGFKIGSTGERGLHLQKNFAGAGRRNRTIFEANIPRSVK
jgi:hypothetical protein